MNRTFKKIATLGCIALVLVTVIGAPICAESSFSRTVAYASDAAPPQPTARGTWVGTAPDNWEDRVIETESEAEPAEEPVPSEEVEVIEESPDRTKPIYEVYKNGWPCTKATAEIQWIIHDLCKQYDLPEKTVYGLVLVESAFDTTCVSQTGRHLGLAQIGRFWITEANMPHFTDDYRSRDLFDPYDNLLTLAEMMCYARDYYHLDYSQRGDLVKYLYWHNTGHDPTRVTNWDYATNALRFGDELVAL